MKRITLLTIIFLMVTGCARVTLMTSKDLVADVQQSQSEQDFNRAWYYLDNIRESNPQYDQVAPLRSELQKATAAFEQQNIDKARKLASAGRWPEAFNVLDDAQKQWKQSEALKQETQSLSDRETLLFNRLRTDLLLDEAHWL